MARSVENSLNASQVRVVIFGVCLCLIVYLAGEMTLNDHKQEVLSRLDLELSTQAATRTKLLATVSMMTGFEQEKQALEREEELIRAKLEIVQKLVADRSLSPKLLKDLSAMIPTEVWLDSISLESEAVTLTGQAYNFAQISGFMKSIGESQFFKEPDAKTQSAGQRKEGGGELSQFTLTAKRR